MKQDIYSKNSNFDLWLKIWIKILKKLHFFDFFRKISGRKMENKGEIDKNENKIKKTTKIVKNSGIIQFIFRIE